MVRPKKPRCACTEPGARYFKPRGVPLCDLKEIALTPDEFEAVKLADFECLYQEDAGRRLGVSRPTFGRILAEARRKIAQALVEGAALKILVEEPVASNSSPEASHENLFPRRKK